MKFLESTIVGAFQLYGGNQGLLISNQDVEAIVTVTNVAMAKFLGANKSKETPVSLVIEDLKGNFQFAGIVEYHPNEDESQPGNWSYVITFDEKDVENTKIEKSNDNHFQRYVANALYSIFNASFTDNTYGYINTCILIFAKALIEWLDNNAATEDPTLEFENYFVASATVEDGVVYKSMIPDEEMKVFIKGDKDIQK